MTNWAWYFHSCTWLYMFAEPYPPIPKARSCNVGPLDVFQEPEIPEDVVVKKKKKITNANPINREGREGNLGWEPVSLHTNCSVIQHG